MADVMADGASGEIDDPPHRYLRGLEMRLGPLPSYGPKLPAMRRHAFNNVETLKVRSSQLQYGAYSSTQSTSLAHMVKGAARQGTRKMLWLMVPRSGMFVQSPKPYPRLLSMFLCEKESSRFERRRWWHGAIVLYPFQQFQAPRLASKAHLGPQL
jgi:hypothetical protein